MIAGVSWVDIEQYNPKSRAGEEEGARIFAQEHGWDAEVCWAAGETGLLSQTGREVRLRRPRMTSMR